MAMVQCIKRPRNRLAAAVHLAKQVIGFGALPLALGFPDETKIYKGVKLQLPMIHQPPSPPLQVSVVDQHSIHSVKSFKCPGLHGTPSQTHGYCTRSITDEERKAKKIGKEFTMWKEEIKTVDGKFSCDKVDLNGSVATDSFCCDVAGRIGEVEKSKQAMWTNNCSKAS
ncbi:hypothetical protein PSTT_01941 [Puccinia striiformis]|uniref:Uncharacterized protein n=1 Tax=Puccinia striiformis TaxID=27350 RepID=A0A2S4W1V6_9BASI|nr:hypothetical protein PSTT_01941 [Puccinia striiformis]